MRYMIAAAVAIAGVAAAGSEPQKIAFARVFPNAGFKVQGWHAAPEHGATGGSPERAALWSAEP